MVNFDLDEEQRRDLVDEVLSKIEEFYNTIERRPISPTLDVQSIRDHISKVPLEKTRSLKHTIGHVIEGLKAFSVP